jgi:predicted  nucleic acid-binding Zn-ribbon protein
VVSLENLLAAYSEAVEKGENIEQLAERLNIKLASLNQRLTTLRSDLRDNGATDEEVKALLPPLVRRTGKRTSNRKGVLAALLEKVRHSDSQDSEEKEVPPEDSQETEGTEVPNTEVLVVSQ